MDITGIMYMYKVYFYIFFQGLESVPVLCSLGNKWREHTSSLLHNKDPVMESVEEYRGISATKSHFVSSISKASWDCCEIPEGLSRAFLHPSLLCTSLKDIIALLTAKIVHFAWITGQRITKAGEYKYSLFQCWPLVFKLRMKPHC